MFCVPVFKVDCSRCTREEYVEQQGPVTFSATLSFGTGERVMVEAKDLCTKCTSVIKAALEELSRPMQKASRGKKEE